jgi:hypothetical protein
VTGCQVFAAFRGCHAVDLGVLVGAEVERDLVDIG